MEAAAASSDGENPVKRHNQNQSDDFDSKNMNTDEAKSKPKRQMKSPLQLEALEKAYAMEKYPSEATRADLSEKLDLSDRQLQMWFCHRRLKDKKEVSEPGKKEKEVSVSGKKSRKGSVAELPPPEYSDDEMRVERNSLSREMSEGVPMGRRYYESQQSVIEMRAIACVEAQLGEPIREDGPILGIEFDPLPPDAFGTPIAMEQPKLSAHSYGATMRGQNDIRSSKAAIRAQHEYQGRFGLRSDYGQVGQSHIYDSAIAGPSMGASSFLHGSEHLPHVHGAGHASRVRHVSQPDRQGHPVRLLSEDDGGFMNATVDSQYGSHPVNGSENFYASSSGQIPLHDSDLKMKRKHKSAEQTRKEMERLERERRKEEDRLMRERQKAEERTQRELKREMERRERFMQKEYIKAENRRKKEELRKEKEELKRRAAIEKATARRLAKESMELIEDEQLELMELAASSKGLPSIVQLDYDTLQNLELFKDSLSVFPPKSVHLNRPFAVQPWLDSEEHIGNLFMVWRFFVAFADVLELWPFNLDEFLQSLHDYESRLLGELHIALLKMIIKDIEDAARTPITGGGTNQSSAAVPEGGHPKIVEGAYAWGFDIRKWRQHLNPLTWPEILRQLAISAGFGPQLKQRNAALGYQHDTNEIKGCEEIVSAIRNGSAAKNAVAVMRNKGLLAPPRSRHRLTPGTLKFAAFYVLALEGSKGLTLLQLAEKVQKSGLRDLSTSRTPEASISVAMNRDTKLFERIAPSTYRVKAPYRKDPADAESILADARKKIQIFENGFVAAENGDDIERADDVERGEDEDSECDVDEDAEVDDLPTPYIATKNVESDKGGNAGSGSRTEILCDNGAFNVQSDPSKEFSSFSLNGSKDANAAPTATGQCRVGNDVGAGNLDYDCDEIDESKLGESWVQGLAEGDYSNLSVEERLNVFLALISIVNEGNTIRAVLEDRLEAANSLRKQMLAEAQLDRSRLKEESIYKFDSLSFMTSQTEKQHISSTVEGSQSPFPVDVVKNEPLSSIAENNAELPASQRHQSTLNGLPSEKALVVQEASTGPDNLSAQQHGYALRRSRAQLKSYIAHRAEEMYVYRSLPLGQDRRHNRYWQFVASPSKYDPGAGRIFVELHDGKWRLIKTEEAFDALLRSLDTRGVRESHLHIMLHNIEASFRENVWKNLQYDNTIRCESSVENGSTHEGDSTVETLSSFRIELGRNDKDRKGIFERYQDFQRWIWRKCFSSSTLFVMKDGKKRSEQLFSVCDACLSSYFFEDIHCPSCHQTFACEKNNVSYKEHLLQCEDKKKPGKEDCLSLDSSVPVGIRLLKALLACVEVSVPTEGLESFWTEKHRRIWGKQLDAASSTLELLQMLTLLENAIKRSHLRSGFQTTKELLASCSSVNATSNYADFGATVVLPWIPQATAAVILRVLELDASIIYILDKETLPHEDEETRDNKLPPGFATCMNRESVPMVLHQEASVKEDITYQASGGKGSKRGRGGGEQGYLSRGHKRVSGAKSDVGRHANPDNGNLSRGLRQGQIMQVCGKGPRTVRRRRAEKSGGVEALQFQMAGRVNPEGNKKSIRDLSEDWSNKRIKIKQLQGVNDNNFPEQESESDDDDAQGQGYEQRNWQPALASASSRWTGDLMENSDEDVDGSEDDDSVEEAGEEAGESMDMDERLDVGNMHQRTEGTEFGDSDYYSD